MIEENDVTGNSADRGIEGEIRVVKRTLRIMGHGEKTMNKTKDADRAPVHAVVMPHLYRPFTTRDGSQACAECYGRQGDPIHAACDRCDGDGIVQLETGSAKITGAGVLIRAVPGNDYCNGIMANDQSKSFVGACLCDCLHVDDVAELLAEKGLEKRPAGK